MGLFKGLKDMKDMAAAAPGMIEQASALQEQAQIQQANAAGQRPGQQGGLAEAAAYQHTLSVSTLAETDLVPIAGVSLDLFVEITRGIAAFDYDQSKLPELAAARGIAAADWQTAQDGWNERIQANPKLAQEFNRRYTGR
jgi:hypothetical protein